MYETVEAAINGLTAEAMYRDRESRRQDRLRRERSGIHRQDRRAGQLVAQFRPEDGRGSLWQALAYVMPRERFVDMYTAEFLSVYLPADLREVLPMADRRAIARQAWHRYRRSHWVTQ
jgi:cation transport regulator ChaB